MFVRVICHHPAGQIEQGVHYIRKSLIYSTRTTFLEKAVVELVYKFDKKSYQKVSRSLKYDSIFLGHKHVHSRSKGSGWSSFGRTNIQLDVVGVTMHLVGMTSCAGSSCPCDRLFSSLVWLLIHLI